MVPPKGCSGHIRADAPLHSWLHVLSFDSAESCQRSAFEIEFSAYHKSPDARMNLLTAIDQLRTGDWQCVASDDPRLKEK
jgi:hypothetical protein